MKHMGLVVALIGIFTLPVWAGVEDTTGTATYVPRAERESKSVYTFKGSGKGLVIKDNVTGEETRYTTKRQKSLYRMSPEAEANARENWENRQAEEEEYAAKAAEEAEAAKAAAAEQAAKENESAEDSASGGQGSETPQESPDAAADEEEETE